MRIEETCCCGARIVVGAGYVGTSILERMAQERQAAREIERWRESHRGCARATSERTTA